MALRESKFPLTELQWLKIHLRLAAREQSGSRLSYRFAFSAEPSTDVTCDIYYTDDALNPMKQVSESERIEIYQGRVEIGMGIIRSAVILAELPHGFVWTPTLHFVLHEDCGMGGSVVHSVRKTFTGPEGQG